MPLRPWPSPSRLPEEGGQVHLLRVNRLSRWPMRRPHRGKALGFGFDHRLVSCSAHFRRIAQQARIQQGLGEGNEAR
ncbi:MAG: hypothetical protein LH470_08005 [Lysobacter sp.]|nr:hypothetical protein [Lysobacter sp.]